jgi:hypothetical protein
MATYYFVIAEDDMWWVRVRGRASGGFLLRSHAVKQAIHSARIAAAAISQTGSMRDGMAAG